VIVPSSAVRKHEGHRDRILVVDDEPAVRCSLRYQLEGAGYEVVEAADGRGVVDIVQRDGIALVVTDIVMPNREGLETIKELRRACPGVPVIAISARGPDYLHTAQLFGACRTFAKPFESALFVETVGQVLALPKRA
jgi:CheY-like chemotaxis protein